MNKKNDEVKYLRQFGIVLAAILSVLGLINFFKGRITQFTWFFAVGIVAFCLAVMKPIALKGPYAVFMKIAHAIGWFNTRAILIIIYLLIVTPIGIIMRILGNDPLNIKYRGGKTTYWISRSSPKPSPERLEKQY